MGADRVPHLSVHAVNIYVRDQERSLRFYIDGLGFEMAFDTQLPGGQRVVGVMPPDGGALLSLIVPTPDSAEQKLVGRNTQVVFITDNVTEQFREWSKRGVRFLSTPKLRRVTMHQDRTQTGESQDPVWGGIFTRFQDVDRNTFTLASFDEVSRSLDAKRREAAERIAAERHAARELEIAKQVQARLFPQACPPLGTLDYSGICLQALQVGGDYYDFLELGRNRLGLVVGDIAGKGMAAALLMANLQANLRSQCAVALDDPRRFLRAVNRLFFENTAESAYATLFFAEYDDESRRLRFVNCGHLCALLFRSDNSVERLDSTATVLGLFKEWDCSTGELELYPGDDLVLYTDGVTESFNAAEEEYGERRLTEAVIRHRERPLGELLDSVVAEVQEFGETQSDDITLIAARCK